MHPGIMCNQRPIQNHFSPPASLPLLIASAFYCFCRCILSPIPPPDEEFSRFLPGDKYTVTYVNVGQAYTEDLSPLLRPVGATMVTILVAPDSLNLDSQSLQWTPQREHVGVIVDDQWMCTEIPTPDLDV